MSTPQNPASEDRSGLLAGMLQSVDALGTNTGRLFGRLYGGLRRKSQQRDDATRKLHLRAERLKRLAKTQAVDIARLTGLLAVISEGVIMQDTEGRVVLMNRAAHELIGSTRQFWASDLGRMFRAARHQTVLDGEVTLGDAQRVEVNDRVIGAQLAIVADQEGTRLGTVLMLRDVTHDALSDRLKDQFVTQMSHELRTPLAAIKGMSEVLLATSEDRPQNRKFLEAISRNVAVLDRMIIELLDISEIGAGSFAVRQQDVELEALLFRIIHGFDARIRKVDLTIGVMIAARRNLHLVGDDRRLQWAIGHLIDNSINYTEAGGSIVVRAGHVADGHVLIEISDTGTGISDLDRPRIFERFYRGEARTPSGKVLDPRGLGQGLFVARAVAEAHGGYLTVASKVGEGSTFTLGLPLEGIAAAQDPLPDMPAAPQIDEPPVDPEAATIPSQATRLDSDPPDTPEEQWD
jgi:signal transduction histidine kinase